MQTLIALLALVTLFTIAPAVNAQQATTTVAQTEAASPILENRISEEQRQVLERITIVTPDQNIPPGLARFSGAWSGEWWGERTGALMGSYVLVVDQITPPTASVIYAGITRAETCRYAAGLRRSLMARSSSNPWAGQQRLPIGSTGMEPWRASFHAVADGTSRRSRGSK